ncbi:MAG: glycosyltransferase [Alphaproteobacteria bacterium]
MKILRVAGGLDAGFGGAPRATLDSARAVARTGLAVHLVFPADHTGGLAPDEQQRLTSDGVTLETFPRLSWPAGPAHRYGLSPALARWLHAHAAGYDVVHAEGAWTHGTVAGLAAARTTGRPIVLSPHEGLTRFDISQGGGLARPLKTAIKRYLAGRYRRQMTAIIYSSALERHWSHPGRGAAGAAMVLPHPVFDDQAPQTKDPVHRAFDPSPDAPLALGYLGRLHPKKNVDRLIAAMALLDMPRRRRVRLTVAGSGPASLETRLRAQAARQGVADSITWAGFLQGDAKTRFLAATDLLCLPSSFECFGIAPVEGMIAGTPVLVSPDTGIAADLQADQSGLVVTAEPRAIADAITRLMDNRPALVELSRRGNAMARKTYSFAAHGQALAALYHDLANGQDHRD